MPENTDLQGFDMVVSLTQEAIDDEIAVVFKDGTFDLPWIVYENNEEAKTAKEDEKREMARIQINKWYPPYAVFQENKIARVYFLIQEGFCFYWKKGKRARDPNIPVYLPMNDWAIRFSVDMNLTNVEGKVGKDKIPQSVREQLEEFKEQMFQVNTLLMNFNNVDLMQSTWAFIPPCKLPASSKPSGILDDAEEANWEKDKNDNIVQQQLVPIMKNLLARLEGSDHPYVFGYVAQDNNQHQLGEKPTFVPTGTNFSTTRLYPDPVDDSKCLTYPLIPEGHEAGKNTLQYLLMTNHKPVSEGGDGSFKASWVTPGEKGAMVISEELVLKYIAGQLFKKIEHLSLSDFKNAHYEDKPSYSAEISYPQLQKHSRIKIEDPKLQINIVIEGGSQQVKIFFKTSGKIPLMLGETPLNKVSCAGKSSLILDFSKVTGNKITVEVKISESSALATDTKWYEDVEATSLAVVNTAKQVILHFEESVESAVGIIYGAVNNNKEIVDAALSYNKEAVQNLMIAFKREVVPSDELSSDFESVLEMLKEKIILPGGQEFFFKNARFTTHRLMVLDIAYKD